jgi:hypothetical protein
LTFIFLISLIMGCFLCRSPISIDLLLKPPPTVASGEIETPALDLLCSKRARREDAGSDLGRAEEEHHTPQLEVSEGGGRTEELVCPEVPVSVVTSPAAATEAGLTRAREANLTEIVTPHPAVGEAAAGEVTAVDASSNLVGQGDACEIVVKATEEAPVCAGHQSPRSQLLGLPPALSPHRVHGLLYPQLGRGLARPLVPFSLEPPPTLTELLKDPSPLGRWGVTAVELPQLPKLQPRMLQGKRSLLPRPGLALVVKAPPASFRRNGQILPLAPRLVETLRPRAIA